jgi:hypothetical protein
LGTDTIGPTWTLSETDSGRAFSRKEQLQLLEGNHQENYAMGKEGKSRHVSQAERADGTALRCSERAAASLSLNYINTGTCPNRSRGAPILRQQNMVISHSGLWTAISSERAPYIISQLSDLIKVWSWAPDGCLTPRQIGRMTVGCNVTLTLTMTMRGLTAIMNCRPATLLKELKSGRRPNKGARHQNRLTDWPSIIT